MVNRYSLTVVAPLVAAILLDSAFARTIAKVPVTAAHETAAKQLVCSTPYRAEVGKPFTVEVSLTTPVAPSADIRPTHVTMITGDYITYSPESLTIWPLERKLVQATIKRTLSGLSLIEAFSDDGHAPCVQAIDAGFTGHLKVVPLKLPYKEPRAIAVQIVDNNDRPLPSSVNLRMLVRSEDAALQGRDSGTGEDGSDPLIDLPVTAGSTSTNPFRITARNYKGGPVHLLATLSIEGAGVVSQESFTFDSAPAEWVPILLAIGGALLYAGYHLLQEPARNGVVRAILWRSATAVFAGTIAYVFADFDLLGLKLDPNNLRTYAILGFVFSFAGIDLLLARRFRPSVQASAITAEMTQPQNSAAVSGSN